MNAPAPPPAWRPWLVAAACYGALAALLLAPVWASSTPLLVGGGDQPDWTGTAWVYWWTAERLAQLQSPFDAWGTFFPIGFSPLSQYNLLDAVLATPLVWLFGIHAAYNLFCGLVLTTTALGAHHLARTAGAGHGAAAVAGVALMTAGHLCRELQQGRVTQALLVFWLLALAHLLRLARGEGGWGLAVRTGLLFAAAHLVYWYHGLFLSLAAGIVWLAHARQWDRGRWARLAVAAGVTLAICLPLVVRLAGAYGDLPGVGRPTESWMHYGNYARGEFGLGMAIKHGHWPFWPLTTARTDSSDQRIALGLLLLALLPLVRKPRGRLVWFALVAAGYLFVLGPYIKWNDGAPRPYALPFLFFYQWVPFFERLWWPERFAVLTLVGLSVLAALHTQRLISWRPQYKAVIGALAVVAVVADAPARNRFLPFAGFPARTIDAALYDGLEGALITVPVAGHDADVRHALWMQTRHGQPILGGLGEHIPDHRPAGYDAYIQDNALLQALADVHSGRWQGGTIEPATIEALRSDGFRWIVIDGEAMSPDAAEVWVATYTELLTELLGPPERTGELGAAFALDPLAGPTGLPAPAPGAPGPSARPGAAKHKAVPRVPGPPKP